MGKKNNLRISRGSSFSVHIDEQDFFLTQGFRVSINALNAHTEFIAVNGHHAGLLEIV
jgi:hypothetical protein